MIIKYIGTILKQKTSGAPLVIREYGGGYGKLARLLLEQYGSNICYQFTEPNEAAYSAAKEKLTPYSGFFKKKRMGTHDEITDILSKKKWLHPDVVIVSGVFAQGVVPIKDFEEGFRKVLDNSKDNTYFIVTGFSPSLINSRLLAKHNLEILNTRHPLINEYLYVFRKILSTENIYTSLNQRNKS